MRKAVTLFVVSIVLFVVTVVKECPGQSRHPVPSDWQYKKLCGKDFWLVVCYQPENWEKTGMEKEPFLTEACYKIPFPKKGSSFYKKFLSMDNPIMLRGGIEESAFNDFKESFGQRYIATDCIKEWTWMCEPGDVWGGLQAKYNVPAPKTRKEAQDLLFKGTMEDALRESYGSHKVYVLDATFQQHIEGASDLVDFVGPEMGTPR